MNTWTDHTGRTWTVPASKNRLKFHNPSHAALRVFVFQRDAYRCRRCPAKAIDVPANFTGRYTLWTDTKTSTGFRDVLIVDHVLTQAAGGLHHPDNLQTLCETCNRRKQKEDKENIAAALARRKG